MSQRYTSDGYLIFQVALFGIILSLMILDKEKFNNKIQGSVIHFPGLIWTVLLSSINPFLMFV